MSMLCISTYSPLKKGESRGKKNKWKPFNSSVIIIKKIDKIICVQNTESRDLKICDRVIASVIENEENYHLKINKSRLSSYTDSFWLVVDNTLGCYRLSSGDILNINQTCYRVNKINKLQMSEQLERPEILASNLKKGGLNRQYTKDCLEVKKPETLREYFCRICLETYETDTNPFIFACLCSGTMGYTHLECFSEWILSKLSVEIHENYKIISWESIKCESCKFRIPEVLKFGEIEFDFLSSLLPEGFYMVLEPSKSVSKISKKIFIISLNNIETFFIKPEGQVIFNTFPTDQAYFYVNKNKICLKNSSQSNETLVMVTKSIVMAQGDSCSLVNGSTRIDLSVKKSSKKFFCFC
jgi:RING-variant domain